MVQLIFRHVISWLLLRLGILNGLCFEKTYKVEHVDFGGWEQIRNTDTFWLIILTVLNPHSTLKSKSCESINSVQLPEWKTNPRTTFVLCVMWYLFWALGLRKPVHGVTINAQVALVTGLDLGNIGLKLWTSEGVLTNEGPPTTFRRFLILWMGLFTFLWCSN